VREMSYLSELEVEVLSTLRRIARGSRAEFYLEDLAARIGEKISGTVGLSPEVLENTLLELEQKGYLRIVRVPSTSKVIKEKLREKVKELNAKLISGKVDPTSYAAQLNEISSKCPSLKFRPLSLTSFSDALKSILALLKSLEEVEKATGDVEVKEELRKEYVANLEELIVEAMDMLEEAKNVAESLLSSYRELQRKIEVIKLDEKVRKLDRSVELVALQEKLQEVLKDLEALRTWVLGGSRDAGRLEQLRGRLDRLIAERELLEARLLIEKREEIRVELEKIINEIIQLEKEIKQAEIEAKIIDIITEQVKLLHVQTLLPELLYNKLVSLIKELRGFDQLTSIT